MENSTINHYLQAFYYAMCTMSTVGYGDISAVTFEEAIFVLALILVGCTVFGYVTSEIASITASMGEAELRHVGALLMFIVVLFSVAP
jgi:hypothetical protein